MPVKNISIPEFLAGGGEAGEIIRSKDWTDSPLGNPEGWPQSLKTCVRIILTSSQPMFVWWGKDLINIYNDAYKTIVGGKHPWAFGKPASEVWKEIWNEVGPRAETVMTQNIGTYDEALLLIMERNGYPEETYYTFSYSPIPGDNGGVGGLICANTNNTDLVINERSIQTLRELATLSYNEKTVESVYKNAADVLLKNNKDFPFAIFFKVQEDLKTIEAVAWSGGKENYKEFPLRADLENPVEGTKNICHAVKTNQITLVKNDGRRINIPKGFWDVIPTEFLHIPINDPSRNRPLAVISIGLNPYRQFNDSYRNFIKLVADQVSLEVNNVLAYEEERKRTQALEKLDKAKTNGVMAIAGEITQQVVSEKILEASEKRYRHLMENLPTAIYTCDAEGYIILYNQAAVDLWGRAPELNKDKWCGSWRIYATDGVTPISLDSCPMAEVLKNKKITRKEIIIEKPGGERVYIQPHPIATYDEQGKITGAINMLIDVTEQRNAQKKIDENQLLFETISNSAPVGLWITNAEGICTFVNETWTNWTGMSFEETIENGWFQQVIEEDKERVLKQFEEAFKAKNYFQGEFRLKRRDGRMRWCLTEGYPFKNAAGEFVGYTGSVTDITGKRHTQDELEKTIEERTKSLWQRSRDLRKSEEKYHRMTEEMQDYAIILLDREGTILNWNTGAKKIKGYSEEEIVGKNFRIFYLPEDVESYLPEKLIAQAVEIGRAENEGWRKRKDGTLFWGSIVITALHDDKDEVIGFSKVTRDLTEKKRSEDTMKKYMQELERQNTELEQFAYVSSHDLQEPLRKIRTFSELLDTQLKDAEHKHYLQKINSSAERMSNLIKDLLNYSRLTKENEKFVAVDLAAILDNVKIDLEVVIEQKKAIIKSDHLPKIKGIPLQFNQLFLNLLSNSLKFNTGQPVITIKARPALLYETVAAKLDPKWNYLRLTFTDNGIGFEPHYSEQIFTIFQRLNTRQKFSGTGIGLAMCKKIIDNHNGYINASSEPGKGATFLIYVPLR